MANQTSTYIYSNGSKWAGQAPDPIEALIERLKTHPLDWVRSTWAHENGMDYFSGNFEDVSAVFSVHTNDPAIIRELGSLFATQAGRLLLTPDQIACVERYKDHA